MHVHHRAARMAAVAVVAGAVLAAGGAVAQAAWEVDSASRLSTEARTVVGRFQRFMSETTGISPQFRDGAGVAAAVRRGAAYDPPSFSEGMTLYAALAALSDPVFTEAVRARADNIGRDPLIEELTTNPTLAARLPGADRAAGRASAALTREGEALIAAGRSIKQAAYDIQRQPWSTVFMPNAAATLAEVKALGSGRPDAGQARYIPASSSPMGYGASPWVATSGTVDRALALAALMTLGEAPDGDLARPLLSDGRTGQCLRMAKMNYHQCLAAAGPQYEGVFCVAVHAMIEPGQCVTAASR
ncbi:MAG: hypothetical protein HY859_03965 [Caulobacterales bacterium]|nr:hypothetical protein [Caulobacterales bacterium]